MKKYGEDGSVAEIVDEERTLASNHVETLKSRVESMQQTRALYESEIETVSRQILASRTEFASVRKQLDTINGLLARGLTTEYRKADLERALAQIAIAEEGFQTLILRARENITQLD